MHCGQSVFLISNKEAREREREMERERVRERESFTVLHTKRDFNLQTMQIFEKTKPFVLIKFLNDEYNVYKLKKDVYKGVGD